MSGRLPKNACAPKLLIYKRTAERIQVRFYFCPNCGATLWESDRGPAVVRVAAARFRCKFAAAGSLDL